MLSPLTETSRAEALIGWVSDLTSVCCACLPAHVPATWLLAWLNPLLYLHPTPYYPTPTPCPPPSCPPQESTDELYLIPAIDMLNHSTEPCLRNTSLALCHGDVEVVLEGGEVKSFTNFFSMKAGMYVHHTVLHRVEAQHVFLHLTHAVYHRCRTGGSAVIAGIRQMVLPWCCWAESHFFLHVHPPTYQKENKENRIKTQQGSRPTI